MHKILALMEVNVYRMAWEDLHVVVQIHIQVNDVKIVSFKIRKNDLILSFLVRY